MSSHIAELHQRLLKDREAIDRTLGPLREQAEALRAQLQPLEAQLREINTKIKAVEQETGYHALNQEIGKLAQLEAGATSKMRRRLLAEGGTVSATLTDPV